MRDRRLFAFAVGVAVGWLLTAALHLHSTHTVTGGAQPSSQTTTTPTTTSTTTSTPSTTPQRRVRILCLIVTHPGNYNTKAKAVNQTWARRCDTHAFVGTAHSKTVDIPLISLNVTESRDSLWQKTWRAFEAAERLYDLDKFDFVLKADDDTYVVMENLKQMLAKYNPHEPLLFGRKFRYNGDRNRPYMSGGAGYVVSRGGVKLFVNLGVKKNNKECDLKSSFSEDVKAADCHRAVGGKLGDSRDQLKREKFHPLPLNDMIGCGSIPDWMYKFNYYNFTACMSCISDRPISFHYVRNHYELEFLIYNLVK